MSGKQHILAAARESWEAQLRRALGEGPIPVYGAGDPDAALVLVGEAPGEHETIQRRPFVGKAGKNLDGFLATLGVAREAIYLTNVVKFRPVRVHPTRGSLSNRPPSRQEIELCAPLLREELAIVAPRVAVTLGNVALRALCRDAAVTIGICHGRPLEAEGFMLFPLYHPASVIYNRSLAETYQQDLLALRDYLRGQGIACAHEDAI